MTGRTHLPFVFAWRIQGQSLSGPHGERGERTYNGGLGHGTEPPTQFRDRAPVQEIRGEVPPEDERLALSPSEESANLYFFAKQTKCRTFLEHVPLPSRIRQWVIM